MSQVKQCMNFYRPADVDPPQEPVPRKSIQILSDRIYAVEGCDGNVNDIIFTAFPERAKLNVIYIGGDIQNFSEMMVTDRDSLKFREEFNLEEIGALLMKRFNEIYYPVHVWIIRPCKYINQKYVVYKGFLPMDNDGVPWMGRSCFNSAFKVMTAIFHLQALINNAVQIENERQRQSFGNICSANIPIALIGFSKGATVLTKIFYELQMQIIQNNVSPIIYLIHDIYWLDSSHNGNEDFWPHDHSMFARVESCKMLKSLAYHAYATPFQIGRPIKLRSNQEFGQLTDILLKLGVQHTSGYLLRGDEINLQTHFDIIKEFPIKRR